MFSVSRYKGRFITSVTDGELIGECLAGDEKAWNELITRYAPLVTGVCLKMGVNREDCADIFQDVCIRLLNHLDELRDHERLAGWLISVTRREVWRLHRKKSSSETSLEDQVMLPTMDVFGRGSTSPEAEVLAIEEQFFAVRAVNQLPEKCKKLLTLLYLCEPPATYSEVTEQMCIPSGSIGPTRARCLQALRDKLKQMGY